MATLVVPTVCRFTVNSSYSGHAVANIVDMHIDTTGSSTDRESAIVNQAGIILHQFNHELMGPFSSSWIEESVSWVDLNSDEGSTGVITSGDGVTAPLPGGTTAAEMPGNVAVLLRKQLATSGRGSRAGRMYIPGVLEGFTASGTPDTLTSTAAAQIQDNADAFKGNIEQDHGGIVDYSSLMVVVHVTVRDEDGHPVAGIGRTVESLQVQTLLATQRRRLRR